jgi:hypothetical protein
MAPGEYWTFQLLMELILEFGVKSPLITAIGKMIIEVFVYFEKIAHSIVKT